MIGARVIGIEGVQRRLAALGKNLDQAEKHMVQQGSILLRRALVRRMTGRSGRDAFWGKTSPSGAYLGARTGQSRARLSPGGLAVKHGPRWQAAVGSPDSHVAFHEKGGTVHGRQFMRIPTRNAQTAGGQDRNVGRSIRDIPDAYLFRSRTGKLWAAIWPEGADRPTLLYLLVRSITYRGRGMFGATRKEIEPQIATLGRIEVSQVVRVANG